MPVWKTVKNSSIISYLWLSLLSPLNSDTKSYTQLLHLKSTNKNARNAIYKIKIYLQETVQGARYITLLYFYKIRLLYIAKIRTGIKIFF